MHRYKAVQCYVIALMVVVTLLFSQLALASYVCPGMDSDAIAMAQAMANGEPCKGMDAVQPVMCHQHATDASQSFERCHSATPSVPAIVQVLVVPLVLLSDLSRLNLQGVPEPRPPPDPLFFSTRRLRV